MGVVRERLMTRREDELIIEVYKSIISTMCKKTISKENLESIKYNFVKYIDSVRRFDWIKTLSQLIQVLEKRGAIGCTNIKELYTIAEQLGRDHNIGQLLILQSKLLSKRRIPPSRYLFEMNMLSSSPPTLPDSVVDCISSNINIFWKQYARALYIVRENTIDRINDNYNSNEERTRQVLMSFLIEAQLQRLGNPYHVLLKALETVKRRDIKEKVELLLNESTM